MIPGKRRLSLLLLCTSTGAAFVSSFALNCVSFPSKSTCSRANLVLSFLSSNNNNEASTVEIADQYRLWKGPVPEVQKVTDMPDPPLHDLQLTKHYYLLRHGQSTANVDEVISSDRTSLAYTNKHGLTELGSQQGRESAQQLVDLLLSGSGSTSEKPTCKAGDVVVFVSSPFARARQTAQACLDGLLQDETLMSRLEKELGGSVTIVPDVYLHDYLLERSFGRLDNEAIYTYAYVWPLDKHDVMHTAFDVESVAAVCTRFHQFINDVEHVQFHTNDNNDNVDDKSLSSSSISTHVVCVSHADVLQIAQLYAANAPNIGEFSSYRFGNGEIRRMIVNGGVESLPAPGPLQAPKRGTGM